jgi:hypothetical protein
MSRSTATFAKAKSVFSSLSTTESSMNLPSGQRSRITARFPDHARLKTPPVDQYTVESGGM